MVPEGRVKRLYELYTGAVLVVKSCLGSRMDVHRCTLMVWSNDSTDSISTLCDAHTGPNRHSTGISNIFHILRDQYGSCTLMDMQGKWHNQNLQKSNKAVVCGRTWPTWTLTVPARAVHGLFMISCGYNACIEKFVRRRTGHVRAPWLNVLLCFHHNSQATARTGTGSVMWLAHELPNMEVVGNMRRHGAHIKPL